MIREAIEKVWSMAVESGPVTVKPPGEPPQVYLLRDGEGNYERVYAEPPPTQHRHLSVESLVDAAVAGYVDDLDKPEIWVHGGGLTLVPFPQGQAIHSHHREFFPLEQSKPFLALRAWDKTTPVLTQMELVRLLRTTFYGCGLDDVLPLIRSVDIEKVQQSKSDIKTTGVSISRKLTAEAGGAEKLPPVLAVKVPVWDDANFGLRAVVMCAFELDAQSEKFVIEPLPGEIRKAATEAETSLYRRVATLLDQHGATDKVRLYHGAPTP